VSLDHILIFLCFSHVAALRMKRAFLSGCEKREGLAMWTCPKCAAEVEDQLEVCWGCGTAPDGAEDSSFNPETEGIVTAASLRQAPRPSERLVTLATCTLPQEAYLLRSRLASAGISAYLAGELMSTEAWERCKVTGGVEVQVAETDLGRALGTLAGMARPGAADRHDDEAAPGDKPGLWEDKSGLRATGEA
jgi:hypothetical protein